MWHLFKNQKLFAGHGKFTFSNRVISLLLSFALLLSIAPRMVLFSVDAVETPDTIEDAVQTMQGKQAIFDWHLDFLLAESTTITDPDVAYDYYYDQIDGEYVNWYAYDEIGVEKLVVRIIDTHYDSENGFIWVKVTARDGETLPSLLQQMPWVLYALDTDEEQGYDPYLAIYDSNDAIVFADYEYTASDSVISSTFVLSGPEVLADATITVAENTTEGHSNTAMSYGDWYHAFDVSITKADGTFWTTADGEVDIRYYVYNFPANTYEADIYYGIAYVLVDSSVYSANCSDLVYDVSDMVSANAGSFTIVFEYLNESFEEVNAQGYFSGESVQLYDVTLASYEEYVAPAPPTSFTVLMQFTVGEQAWYWISWDETPCAGYFLVPAENVTFVDIADIYWNLVETVSKEGFAEVEVEFADELAQFTYSSAQQADLQDHLDWTPYRADMVYTPWSGRVGPLMPPVSVISTYRLRNAVMAADTGTDGGTSSTDGIEKSKIVKQNADGTYTLVLESYVTGAVKMTSQKSAVDVVLVLDLSQSMDTEDVTKYEYSQITSGTAQSVYQDYEKVYVKINEEYRQVSISGTNPTTIESYTKYEETGNNSSNTYRASNLYDYIENDGNTLYYKVGSSHYPVTVDRTRNSDRDNYTYTFYYVNGSTSTQIGNTLNGNSTFGYTLFSGGVTTTYDSYTYTYTDASGNSVTNTYAPTDSIVGSSVTYYYADAASTTTRIAALQDAVTAFTKSVLEAAAEDNIDHRVSIITYNSTATVQCPLLNVSIQDSANAVTTASKNLAEHQNQGTRSDLGLAAAVDVFNGEGVVNDSVSTTSRQRVVLFFTDGHPTTSRSFNVEYASNAINNAHTLKSSDTTNGGLGATVYSVCIMDGADPTATVSWSGTGGSNVSDALVNAYMHAVSSNYPNAEAAYSSDTMTITPGEGSNQDYYLTASSTDDLNGIFDTVSKVVTSGGANIELGTETVVRDVISPYFTLPEGASSSDIKVYTSDYLGPDGEGKDQWAERVSSADATVVIQDDGKTIDVSNFDFMTNFVGSVTDTDGNVTYRGKKLIIEIPIEMIGSFLGGEGVPTNEATSGIYFSSTGNLVDAFEVPSTDIPLAKVTYATLEKHIYYGNKISLTDLLDRIVRSIDNAPLEGVADRNNNAFVDMQFAVTTGVGAEQKKYVFTLPAGKNWSEGVWSENGVEAEYLKNLLVDSDLIYSVNLVMDHSDFDMLRVSVETAKLLVSTNYSAGWEDFQAALTAAEKVANDSAATDADRSIANLNLMAAIDALTLTTTGSSEKIALQRAIYLATAIVSYVGDSTIPYKDALEARLEAANDAMTNFGSVTGNEDAVNFANASMADAAEMLNNIIDSLIRYTAVQGEAYIYVYKPVLTFRDSVRDYLSDLYYYTDASFAAVREKLSDAVKAVSTAASNIAAAICNLVPAASYGNQSLDKLHSAMLIIQSLDKDHYVDDTYQAAQDLLTEKEADKTLTKIQDALNTSATDINSALKTLRLSSASASIEEHSLKLWITVAEGLTESNYSTDSYSAMAAALTSAKNVLADSASTSQQMIDAANALSNKIDALDLAKQSGDNYVDNLQKALLISDSLQAGDFTVTSYSALNVELSEMDERLSLLTVDLLGSIEDLELKTDFGHESVNALCLAMQIQADLTASQFTTESYQALTTEITQIGTLVDGKADAIDTAIADLELIHTDKIHLPLRQAILKAKYLTPGHYVDFSAVASALSEAEAAMLAYQTVYSTSGSTDAEKLAVTNSAQAAADKLNAALSNLQLANTTANDKINALLPSLLLADGLRTMKYADTVDGKQVWHYPDLQAFLDYHWEDTQWIRNWVDSAGVVQSTNSNSVDMDGEVPVLELTYDFSISPDAFQYGLMYSKTDVPVGVTVNLYGHDTAGALLEDPIELTRADVGSGKITFLHKCEDRPDMLCFFDPTTEEFVVHVRNLALVIDVSGLPDDCTDTFLFQIFDGTNYLYVTIQGNGRAIIMGGLSSNVEYTVTQITDWSWIESLNGVVKPDDSIINIVKNTTNGVTVKLVEDSAKTNHIIFDNSYSSPDWLSDEDYIDNSFGQFNHTAP